MIHITFFDKDFHMFIGSEPIIYFHNGKHT